MFKFTNPLQSIASIIVYYSKTIQNGNFQSPSIAGQPPQAFYINVPPASTSIMVPGWKSSGGAVLIRNRDTIGWYPTTNTTYYPSGGQVIGLQSLQSIISQTLSLNAKIWTLEMGLCGRSGGANPINITLSGPPSFTPITISLSAAQIGTDSWKTLAVARGSLLTPIVTTFDIPELGTYTLSIGSSLTGGLDATTFISNVTLVSAP